MKRLISALSIALITMSASFMATANSEFKYPVYVSHTGDDTVGSRIAFNVRNLVRSSPHLRLSNEVSEPHFGLYLISMPNDNAAPSNASVLSVVFTFDPGTARYEDRYLTSMVGQCGSSRASNCAEGYVAGLDEAITQFERYFGDDVLYLFNAGD